MPRSKYLYCECGHRYSLHENGKRCEAAHCTCKEWIGANSKAYKFTKDRAHYGIAKITSLKELERIPDDKYKERRRSYGLSEVLRGRP